MEHPASSVSSSRRAALPSPSGRTTARTTRRFARMASMTGRAPSIKAKFAASTAIARTLLRAARRARPGVMTVDSFAISLGRKARSPAELLAGLPPDSQPHLLDARAEGGWGETFGAPGGERSFLGVRPEVTFRGGREALDDAR